jgi:hypothetical protein
MRQVMALAGLLLTAPAGAQGLPNLQGLGGMVPGLGQPQTPEEKRGFCTRVATAAARCATTGGLSLDVVGLTGCLVKALPPQDGLRVAQVAQRSQGNAGAVLGECGIGR